MQRSTRFTSGNQFSRKSVASVFSCVLGNKTPLSKNASKLTKKEPLDDTGNGKECKWHIDGRASLSQLLTLEETGDPDRADVGQQNRKDRQRVKMNLPLLHKKKRCRVKFSNGVHGNRNSVVTMFGQVRRKACLRHLIRIPSKILVIRLKLKMIRSFLKKKVTKQFEQGTDDENGDRELCKKRILMGVRCRPLNSPSTPSYDTHVLFLPRDSFLTRAPRRS